MPNRSHWIPESRAQIQAAIEGANVRKPGHLILSNGRQHSLEKLEMERIINAPEALRLVRAGLEEVIRRTRARLIVPVPRGAVNILRSSGMRGLGPATGKRPEMITPLKLGIRHFSFSDADKMTIERHAHDPIIIFDDVTSTGGNQAAMAEAVQEVAPRADRFVLASIWRRGQVLQENARIFNKGGEYYLVEEEIPVWAAANCPDQSCNPQTVEVSQLD